MSFRFRTNVSATLQQSRASENRTQNGVKALCIIDTPPMIISCPVQNITYRQIHHFVPDSSWDSASHEHGQNGGPTDVEKSGDRTFAPLASVPGSLTSSRAAVGMGIPMGIPMGMGMGWVWELWWIPMGTVGILREFLKRICDWSDCDRSESFLNFVEYSQIMNLF